MGVVLYREGNTHVNRGIKCEACVFPVDRMQANLNAGWVTDPRKLYEVNNAISEDEQVESQESSEASNQEEGNEISDKKVLSSKEVREHAKLAGVENWDTARIKTLKDKLGYESLGNNSHDNIR